MLAYRPNSNWFSTHSAKLFSAARIVFGLVWILDGFFKFAFNTPSSLVQIVTYAGVGQPAWLAPWFAFWANTLSWSPVLSQLLIGGGEMAIGLLLVAGVLRKTVYALGLLFSLSIWAIPQSFGGPWAAGKVEVGSGFVYALAFLLFLLACSLQKDSLYTLDGWFSRRVAWWARWSQF